MIWDEAIKQAKEELGFSLWEDYVERAKEILSKERKKIAKYEHKKYLNSEYWKRLRLDILKRDNFICQDCEKIIPEYLYEFDNFIITEFLFVVPASEVHHLDYQYKLTDLESQYCISLCNNCHELRHCFNTFGSNYLKENIENNIFWGIYPKIITTPESISQINNDHDEFLKSITIKPEDWKG